MSERVIYGGLNWIRSLRYGAGCAGLLCVLVAITSIAFSSDNAPPTALQTNAFLLESGKAGPFELGASVDEIYSLVGRDHVRLVDLFMEGMFTPALEIQVPGSNTGPSIIALIREWPCRRFSVWSIEVRDPRFRTREGLGVGSALGELRRRYKVGGGRYATYTFIPSLDLTFVFDGSKPTTDLSKAKSVLVPAQPKEVRRRRCPELGLLQ